MKWRPLSKTALLVIGISIKGKNMVKPILFIGILSFLTSIVAAQTPYKLDTMPEGDGIIVEKFKPKYRTNRNRFTENNRIYKERKTFLFDFHYFKEGVERGFFFGKMVGFPDNPDGFWHFCPIDSVGKRVVASCELVVMNGGAGLFEKELDTEDYQQTVISWNYLNKNNEFITSESTGLVENESNIWMHPPRSQFFAITEANPFPYIKTPYKIGTSWNWKLAFGGGWSQPAWMVWKGRVDADYDYKIVGKDTLETALGKLDCWIVDCVSTSRIGKTILKAHFSEKYGFVKLDYTNIDGSKLIFDLKKMSE
jgi:hypothetical protein